MAAIRSDRDLRQMLEGLNQSEQSRIGAAFVEHALDLCDDPRVRRAMAVARNPNASDEERADAFHSAKALMVSTYAECGRDTDWSHQAAHFVASAAACLVADEASAGTGNRAWRIAMQVRNARNCAAIAVDRPEDGDDEAEAQRRIANELAGG